MITEMTELLSAIRIGKRVIAQRDRLSECRILISEVRNAMERFENWEVHPTRQFIGPRAHGHAGLLIVMRPTEVTHEQPQDSYGPVHPRIQAVIGRHKSKVSDRE
jgi:hypothetical protein